MEQFVDHPRLPPSRTQVDCNQHFSTFTDGAAAGAELER